MSTPTPPLSTAEKLLDALGSLGYLEESAASARLQAAFRGSNMMNSLRGYFLVPEGNESNWDKWLNAGQSCVFDDVDRTSEIQQLGNAAMAVVMTKMDDPWGFKNLCDPDVALKIPDGLFDKLMSSLFAEHVNHHLEAQNLPPLHKLGSDSNVVRDYKALVTADEFDPLGSRPDPHYAMTLLFVHEYFSKGAGFQLSNETENVHSHDVFRGWQANVEKKLAFAADAEDKSPHNELLAKYAYVWTAVVSPQGIASAGIDKTASLLLSSGALTSSSVTAMTSYLKELDPREGTIFDPRNLTAYRGVSHRIWGKWVEILNDHSPGTFWRRGLQAAQNESMVTDTSTLPVPYMKITTTTRVHAPGLAVWHSQLRGMPYMKANSELKNVTYDTERKWIGLGYEQPSFPGYRPQPLIPHTCFVPGTKIRTSRGDVDIQDLCEGDRVCTRLQPTQWGVRSCERVENPSPESIYGFNNEPAFFTPGHVFHTTTGLRAVEPSAARAENPWLEVGQLAVGHTLLRAVDDEDEYEEVFISSIHSEPSKHKYVYGIHLREGLRSYHANGYLVALNYPEITVSMIAKRLVSLNPVDQVRILRSMQELQPILARFGAATALDLLAREAQSNSLNFGGKPEERHELLARDIDLPFVLTFDDDSDAEMQVDLLHGILNIEGEFCEAASFDKSTLTWSRPLPDGQWEHAYCVLTHNGQSARGYMTRGHLYETEDPDTIVSSAKRFKLTPGTLTRHGPEEVALMAETATEQDILVDPSTQGLVDVSANLPQSPFISMMVTESKAPTFSSLAKKVPLVFPISYDPTPLSTEQSAPAPNPNVRCGNFVVPVENNHWLFPKLRFEDYDIVRDALAAKFRAEQESKGVTGAAAAIKLPTFYKHRIAYDERNRERHMFELRHTQALLEASDEYQTWKATDPEYRYNEPPSKNLHYTNIGLPASFTLAQIWQAIQVEKSLPTPSGIITLTGVARPYSMDSDGNEGAAYYIVGTYTRGKKTVSPVAAKAVSSFSTTAASSSLSAHIAPSPVVSFLAKAADDDKDANLQALTDVTLNQAEVNASAQTMMFNVMQWHMADNDRRMFFNVADKPAGLPAEFTMAIENTPTAEWIRETYAKAYMCQVLAQNDGNIRDEYRFSKEEKKNARYFWNGKGKDCLSRSKLYQRLERAISRYQMRKKYDIIGKIYDQGKGVEYSDDLYEWFTGDELQLDSISNNQSSGTNMLTKLCAIMDALDNGRVQEREVDSDLELGEINKINDTNSNMLVYAANANQKGDVWLHQYWGYKSDDEKTKALEAQWLKDTLVDFVEKLLNNDPAATGPAMEGLRAEMEEYGKQIEGWQNMSARLKAQKFGLVLGDRLPKLMQALSKVFGWIYKGGKWIIDNTIRRVGRNWQQNAAAVGEAADWVIGEQPVGVWKGPVCKAVLVVVGMAAIGAMIWNFSDKWSEGTTADRGIIITTVLMGFRQLADLSIDAVWAIMRYKKGVFSEAAELGIYTKFDNLMEKRLGSKWAAVLEGKDGKKMMRNLSRAEAADPLGLVEKRSYVIGPETKELTVRQSLERLDKMSKVRKGFNIARRVVSVLGYMLSIGLAIFLTWQLVENWDKMDLGTRIFETIQVVLACIEGLGAAIVATATIAWGIAALAGSASAAAIGAFAVAAASIFASVAIVLAAIAAIVFIAFLIWQSKQPAPPNSLETWMKDVGKPWAQAHPAPADPLEPDVSPSSVPFTDDTQTVRVGFTNKTEKQQTIEYIALSFAGGKSDGAVFTWDKEFVVSPDATDAGKTRISATPDNVALVMTPSSYPSTLVEGDMNNKLIVEAADKKVGKFDVPARGRVEITIFGGIKSEAGKPCTIAWSFAGEDDVFEGGLKIERAKKN
ncbi:hypothetical protein QBC38DRAFT_121848 [Podospora fimiseda]|uniref:Uncharacterized protein n=1 Tax=Podospora fimiseda TaxID=252190 RepID=A0AAN6YPK4_9PEZI|nr:hypothetical protein QBC38DRAFT_121848 [Podospora fimiseda]